MSDQATMKQQNPNAPQIVVNRTHLTQANEPGSGLSISRAAGAGVGAVIEVWADGVKMQIFLPVEVAMNAAVGLIANAAISQEYAVQRQPKSVDGLASLPADVAAAIRSSVKRA